MPHRVLLLLPCVALLLSACPRPDLEGRPCEGTSDCIEDYRCVARACTRLVGDAGPGFETCSADFFPAGLCAGDIVGDWSVDARCVGADTTLPAPETGFEACGGYTATAIVTDVEGEITFESDGSFDAQIFGEVTWEVHVPDLCTGNIPCADFAITFVDAANCVDAATDGCDCTGVKSDYDLFESGSYATDDNGLITLESSRRLYACPSADTLVLAETNGTGGLGPNLLTTR